MLVRGGECQDNNSRRLPEILDTHRQVDNDSLSMLSVLGDADDLIYSRPTIDDPDPDRAEVTEEAREEQCNAVPNPIPGECLLSWLQDLIYYFNIILN